MRRFTILVTLSSVATSYAQFRVLPGQRIAIHGDSITRGYGFGNYTDPSPLRSLHGIASILMQENLAPPPALSKLTYQWRFGPDKMPVGPDTVAAEVKGQVQRGEIRPGDWLIYEDAGGIDDSVHPAPWPNAKDMYARYRKSLRDMIHEAENTIGRDHILLMTMFDYEPSARCRWCRWDAPLDDGRHSGNDAIRDEAIAQGVQFIDMNRIMDAANSHTAARARQLALDVPDTQPVAEQIEYIDAMVQSGRGKFQNPPGFYVWAVENNLGVPASFETERMRKLRQDRESALHEAEVRRLRLMEDYEEFRRVETRRKVAALYPGHKLDDAVRERVKQIRREQPEWHSRMTDEMRREAAMGMIEADVRERAQLPSFEQWSKRDLQMRMF